ncbi:capsular polysaccharide synthesis protein [Helicobacter burdigaliensis]|uniref:capsular polysaccharide synthesis protein n=1 Tax=Helicobacter burdigaliensis TaxID=2315334 RepID=UPI000EF66995|nr:capsular polysaccharide synthesis protein [Helicobacter burdigaliensis]
MNNASKVPFWANNFTLAISKMIPFKSLRRQIKGKITYKMEHSKVADYLKLHYVEPYFKGELQRWDFAPKVDFKDDKIIWQLWFQGESEAPETIRVCFDFVKKHMGEEYKVIILDQNNIKDYIDLPSFVYERALDKDFSAKPITIFSDLLRVALLSTYGGVWMDASLYLSAPLDKKILESNFFAYLRSQTPPKDYKKWIGFDCNYFNWEEDFRVRILNGFLVAKKNNLLIRAIKDIFMNYYIKEKKHIHYFTFQILFDLLYRSGRFTKYMPKDTNDTDVHLLHFYAKEKWSKERWEWICSKSPIHKLTNLKLLQGGGRIIDYLLEK